MITKLVNGRLRAVRFGWEPIPAERRKLTKEWKKRNKFHGGYLYLCRVCGILYPLLKANFSHKCGKCGFPTVYYNARR